MSTLPKIAPKGALPTISTTQDQTIPTRGLSSKRSSVEQKQGEHHVIGYSNAHLENY